MLVVLRLGKLVLIEANVFEVAHDEPSGAVIQEQGFGFELQQEPRIIVIEPEEDDKRDVRLS